MISELTTLSPAEILLIESPDVKVDQLARVTFFDLLLKGILQIEDEPTASAKKKKNPLVGLGDAYFHYRPLKHEAIFLHLFHWDLNLKVRLAHLLKTAFENIKNSDHYKLGYVYTNKRMKPYFQSNFFQKLVGIKIISEKGLVVQQAIKDDLKRIKSHTNRRKLSSVDSLLALNGNIVLIPKIPISLFQQIEQQQSEFRKRQGHIVGHDLYYSNLYQHNTTKDQFQLLSINDADFAPIIESVDGFNDASGDGCGGDGGCGGCGGCGCG
ncbi:MAG: hypothetical protein AAGI23_04215 [Bacteroidota bacterium]